MIPAENIEYAQQIFVERLGQPYEFGGDWSPTDLTAATDCSGLAGEELEAVTKGSAMAWGHPVSTESWPYNYGTNTAAPPGTIGPYGTIAVSFPGAFPADAAATIAIHHGGGGVDSHMNICVDGMLMEDNGDAGVCTTVPPAIAQTDPYWTDWWYLPGPISGTVTPPVLPTPVLYGIDISNNNFGGPTAPNLSMIPGFVAEVVKEGFSWIEAKVSEGSTFADPTWTTIYRACQDNNIPVVAFHFLDTSDPNKQAQNCLAALNGAKVKIMLDWESGGGDFSTYEAVWHAFTNVGLDIVLEYIPNWYWQQQGSPDLSSVTGLISSSWVSGSGYASALYPGDSWAGWDSYGNATPVILQFTNQAQVAGMSLDADAFRGSLDDLNSLLGLGDNNPFMALTQAQQEDLYNFAALAFQQLAGVLSPPVQLLPGSPTPTGTGWPQLGQNAQGQNLTTVDALAAVATAVNALSSDFKSTSTGLAVLQKLAELQQILGTPA